MAKLLRGGQKIFARHDPALLERFIQATDILRTRPDFQIGKLPDVFDEATLQDAREFIAALQTAALEQQELFRFGRLIVHDHPHFNRLQETFTDLVSEIAQEPVEPCYNFLSLYNNLGVCEVHMDAPYAKWTLDICIDQSEPWPIHFSRVRPWPEAFEYRGDDWEVRIKADPENQFTGYALEPGEGIVFAGSSQWHYRERIQRTRKSSYCHLVFFHFIPKGAREIIDPSEWADLFGVPELAELDDGKTRASAYSIAEIVGNSSSSSG
jgi:hypothetical protein